MPYADREKNAQYIAEWRQRNPEKSRLINKRYRDKMRMRVLVAYSSDPPRCACCGEWRLQFLTLDHVNGGGNADRREVQWNRGGIHQCRLLVKRGFPPGFQVLCWNCNGAKGSYGRCPHEDE